jgi:hypothetical protein
MALGIGNANVPVVATSQEQRILVSQAEPGMILARPVVLPDNEMVLCPKNTVLDDVLIARIGARGVKRIHVQGHPLKGHRTAMDYDTHIKRLAERFSRVQHVPFMRALQLSIERILARRGP